MKRVIFSLALVACTVDASAPAVVQPKPALANVRSWAYVIQKQTEGDRIERLAKSDNDLVVMDDPRSFDDMTDYDARADVTRLHATKKIVVAYIDIGEAEDYRAYWKKEWSANRPSFVVADDPSEVAFHLAVRTGCIGMAAEVVTAQERVALVVPAG